MSSVFDFEKVSVSWTKYDIVRVVDLVESREVMEAYYSHQSEMDPAILRAALLLREDSDPLPDFWDEVFSWDLRVRRFFMFFLFLFSNGKKSRAFADLFYKGPFRGVFSLEEQHEINKKERTNLRALLVESGLASIKDRRSSVFPFDGSILLNENEVGRVFKRALLAFIRKNSERFDEKNFDTISTAFAFHKILGLSEKAFKSWLNGTPLPPSSITSFSARRFLCFDRPIDLFFGSSKEVYFIGENGDGKTLLLMTLFATIKNYRIQKEAKPDYIGAFNGFVGKLSGGEMIANDDLGQFYRLDSAPFFNNCFAYGVHRGRYSPPSDKDTYERYGFMTLFNTDMTLRDPVDWLQKSIVEYPLHPELSFDNLQRVCCELLERKLEIKQEGTEVVFWEKGARLTLSEISEGYRSTLIFLCDLLIRLSDNCPESQSVFDQPGVVLIDEICLHLHPKWQRTIVRKLRSLFPKLQFIMTTHSPIILLGAGEDAIFYKVIRENGRSYVSQPYSRNEWTGQMLNTIATSSLFDLDSAAINGSGDDVDTSDSFVLSRIARMVNRRMSEQKAAGKIHFSEEEIDRIINEILDSEE